MYKRIQWSILGLLGVAVFTGKAWFNPLDYTGKPLTKILVISHKQTKAYKQRELLQQKNNLLLYGQEVLEPIAKEVKYVTAEELLKLKCDKKDIYNMNLIREYPQAFILHTIAVGTDEDYEQRLSKYMNEVSGYKLGSETKIRMLAHKMSADGTSIINHTAILFFDHYTGKFRTKYKISNEVMINLLVNSIEKQTESIDTLLSKWKS